MIRGAIFDLDGTLVDSMRVWDHILTDYLDARGLFWEPEILQAIATMGLAESAAYVRETYGLAFSPEEIIGQWEEMVFHLYEQEVEPKAGAVALVSALHAAGVPCCVATSNFRASTEAALRHIGLGGAFCQIFTSDEIGQNKTRPDIYLAAAERCGAAPEECLVVEDMLEAVRTAKSAGFRVCAVFDETSSRGVEEQLRAEADWFVHDLTELMKDDTINIRL